jgi:CHAT domain-containing protein/Tfp pilus assembly protein PilF
LGWLLVWSSGVDAGAVVDNVTAGEAAARAGLRPGDVIEQWRAADTDEAFTDADPWALGVVEWRLAPAQAIEFSGTRAGKAVVWRVDDVSWGLTLRYPDVDAGAARDDARRSAWQARGRGVDAARAGDAAASDAAFDEAERALPKQDADARRALLHLARAVAWRDRNDWARVDASLAAARAALRDEPADGVWLAGVNLMESGIERLRGGLVRGRPLADAALAAFRQHAPNRLRLGDALENHGMYLRLADRLSEAEAELRDALAIRVRAAPVSTAMANAHNNLGLVLRARGDLDGAERELRAALALRETLMPDSLPLAASLNNLGLVLWDRGDLVGAEEIHLRSRTMKERLAPGSLDIASSCENLAYIALDRDDLAAAERLIACAVEIEEAKAPNSHQLAGGYYVSGMVARRKGDSAAARAWYERAIAMWTASAPETLRVAWAYNAIANTYGDAGDYERALSYHERARTIRRRLAPGGLDESSSLHGIGVNYLRMGQYDDAEAAFRGAAEIRARVMPESFRLAESLNGIGYTYKRRGDTQAAARELCRAAEVLESARGRSARRDEDRLRFSQRYGRIFSDCVEALIDGGRIDAAFDMLERSRGRAMLAVLAERDLQFAADVPVELTRERAVLDAAYEQAQARLAAATDDSARAEQERALSELRQRQDGLIVRVRRASPRYAALRYPQPLRVAQAAQRLDQGSVVLAYVVGEQFVRLLVLEAGKPAAHATALRLARAELTPMIEQFLQALRDPAPSARAVEQAQGAALYRALLAPASPWLKGASRVLISADAELLRVPFAALRDDRDRYVIERWPITQINSVTLFDELRRRRQREAAGALAVGDPDYGQASAGTAARLRLNSTGEAIAPLPAARVEVDALRRVFGARAAVLTGAEATEAGVRARIEHAGVLHFAVHGVFDDRLPLNSALLLAGIQLDGADGADNGLLQAWEVFDQVRVRADLVALSACDSARGAAFSGEGLVGLTRAFQYAGARGVLASLWSVADASTASLMARFYRYRAQGKRTDEALRAAQLDALRGALSNTVGDAAGTRGIAAPSPRAVDDPRRAFHWAAFSLYGDWW